MGLSDLWAPALALTAEEKALADISFRTSEPQASCVARGASDIFWMTSKRPHFGHSYS